MKHRLFITIWIIIVSLIASPLIAEHTIIEAEYFFNNDPGEGNGTYLNTDSNTFQKNITLPNVSYGNNTIYVRAKDSLGRWGKAYPANFIVVEKLPPVQNTYDMSIIAAEYFIDNDPGQGKGIAIQAIDGFFNDKIEQFAIDNISVNHLSLGKHTLFVRGKSHLGFWGPTKNIQFKRIEKNPPIQNEYQMSITAAEYFIDTDPGQGNGIPIIALDGNFDSKIENFEISNIAVSHLPLGTHTVFVRGKNQLNIWGPTKQYPFERIEKHPPTQETYHMTLTDAEYFIDTDPGEGNATPVLATDGSFDEKIEHFSLSGIAVNHLSPGNHTLFVRGKDNFGRWGKPKAFQFHIEPVAGSADDYYIIAAEYFIDTDPGKGKGISIKASDGNMDSIYEQFSMDAIDISYLSQGNHRLYVRGQRNDGVWGAVYAKTFFVPEGLTPSVEITTNTPLSGEAPFTTQFTADFIHINPQRFKWDLDNDRIIDAVTYDSQLLWTFDKAGDYRIQVIVVDVLGREYVNHIVIHVTPSQSIHHEVILEPFYPESHYLPSYVMTGGRAIRWYRLLDLNHHLLINKKLHYQWESEIFTSQSDDQGFIAIKSPQVEESTSFAMTIVDQNGNEIYQDNLPFFSVIPTDREFKETYTLLLDVGLELGLGGPGASMGPMAFKTLEVGFSGKTSMLHTEIHILHNNTIDVEVNNINEISIGLNGFAGFSGTIFKEYVHTKGRPKIEAGMDVNLEYSQALSTCFQFKDFLNNDSNDHHDQLMAATGLFFENLVKLNPGSAGNIIVQQIFNAIIQQVTGVDDYYQGFGHESTVSMDGSIKGSISLTNPLGKVAGSGISLDISAIDSSYIFRHERENDVNNTSKLTNSIHGNIKLAGFHMGLSQKFGGDKRRKSTPKFNIPSADFHIGDFAGEQQISFETSQTGQQINFQLMTNRSSGNELLFNSIFNETFLMLKTNDPQTINTLSANSPLIQNIVNDQSLNLSPFSYHKAFDAFTHINQGNVFWQKIIKENNITTIPINIGASLGAKLGLSFNVDMRAIVKYTSQEGIITPETGMIRTAEYDKDQHIQVIGYQSIINEYLELIQGVIHSVMETVEKVKEKGKALILETKAKIIEGGAMIKAGAKAGFEQFVDFTFKITSFQNDQKRSYRIRTDQSETVMTVGNVFVLAVQSQSGETIESLPEALTLTVGYTSQDLNLAGYSMNDAHKLRLYLWNSNTNYYTYIGGQVDISEQSVSSAVVKTGQYVLAIDADAPTINQFSISNGTSMPKISFRLQDELSGIQFSEFQVYLDDQPIADASNYSECIQPSTGFFEYKPHSELSSGIHEISITTQDTSGNSAAYAYTFVVNNQSPQIWHAPLQSWASDEALSVSAVVTDDDAIKGVYLNYRPKTNEQSFETIEMYHLKDTSTYIAEIQQDQLTHAGLRYFIQAIDNSGNITQTAQMDIVITDTSGPALTKSIECACQSGLARIMWQPSTDVDTDGYYVWIAETPEKYTLYQDTALTLFVDIPEMLSNHLFKISAYDIKGNMGSLSHEIRLPLCQPGLKHVIDYLQVLSGIRVDTNILIVKDIASDNKLGLAELIDLFQVISKNSGEKH
ncbi:conserved hypothetical protein, secreted [Candidatus Magnetomorum sp. HK-1]|nr:conserved hypothetical protein, secreted [Candidatus Magnetomorum sp. HK-1]